jgi:thymidylate kinase
MAWIILEGIDRTGKSSVSELYKKKGFEHVHFTAPAKKYKEPGYAGPSYADDILEMYMQHDMKDVIFDRSIYGEAVWPYVYGRESQLSEDDVEMLREFEERNTVERILMIDPDTAAHWKRCVDNKEPLNNNQFRLAGQLFNKMAHKYGFQPRELKDYVNLAAKTEAPKQDSAPNKQEAANKVGPLEATIPVTILSVVGKTSEESELDKLEKANAIKDVLSKRIIKPKGGAFDKLEEDIKAFLKNQLSNIFSEKPNKVSLSEEEIHVLKVFCQRLKEKEVKK